jgi:hypothetical protein
MRTSGFKYRAVNVRLKAGYEQHEKERRETVLLFSRRLLSLALSSSRGSVLANARGQL